tara:strand:- start:6063 stop:6386 length:324 start_codon:yes stop_codon:yes gene_type:complete
MNPNNQQQQQQSPQQVVEPAALVPYAVAIPVKYVILTVLLIMFLFYYIKVLWDAQERDIHKVDNLIEPMTTKRKASAGSDQVEDMKSAARERAKASRRAREEKNKSD